MGSPSAGGVWTVLLALVVALAVTTKAEVANLSPQGDLGEGRQAVLDLWTHTEGAPRGQEVSLDLPDGEDEEVKAMVAAKKIDIAAAGLHHATVLQAQALEHKKVSDEKDETEIVAARIADVKVDRLRRELKSAQEQKEKLNGGKADLLIKEEEAKAALAMASDAKKVDLEAAVKLAAAKRDSNEQELVVIDDKIKELSNQVFDAKEGSNAAHQAQDQTRLLNVADRVKLQAATEQADHAKFMDLKSRNMKKLAVATFAKENSHKAAKQAKNDVKGAKDMLDIMQSGPGEKEAAASLERAKKKEDDTQKQWIDATKKVDKVKNEVNDNEVDWAKKMAYKEVMKTAKLRATANEAEKGFQNALSDADKNAKRLAIETVHKELQTAEKVAEKGNANAEHVKFAAKQDKANRAEIFKEEEAKMNAAKEMKDKQKADAETSKKAMAGTGEAPALDSN